MNTFTKSTGALALVAVVALSVGACSSDRSGDSSIPTAVPSITVPTEVPTGLPTESDTLPTGWPADIPVPTGLALSHVIQSPTTTTGKIAIYYGTADKAAVVSQMSTGLESAGYTQVSAKNHGAAISISMWKKGATNVALNINTAAGKVTCSISVNPIG